MDGVRDDIVEDQGKNVGNGFFSGSSRKMGTDTELRMDEG